MEVLAMPASHSGLRHPPLTTSVDDARHRYLKLVYKVVAICRQAR
jgi:hypothetical protein